MDEVLVVICGLSMFELEDQDLPRFIPPTLSECWEQKITPSYE